MQPLPSSYRDNDGFVFEHNGKIYRYLHPQYEKHLAMLMETGLCTELMGDGSLIGHEQVSNDPSFQLPAGRVVLPAQVPFISYPYEWSFDMWKDAALLTLDIANRALKKGMMLKDATPFNIQFIKGKPIFIDTLSFEIYPEDKPWVAYRQFCESFLAPLLLMKYCHPATGKIFTVYPNGIPLEVLTKLLPFKAKWNISNYLHIYLQANIKAKHNAEAAKPVHFPKKKLEMILNGLTGYVSHINFKKIKTTWDDYYSNTILGKTYLDAKTALVQSFLQDTSFDSMIDLGANDGHFSLLFPGKRVVAVDSDANCINDLYNVVKKEKRNILPLVADLMAPSPAIGFNNNERSSITQRLKGDIVMALALVHHLAIAHNVPLQMIADWLQPMGKYLLVEFVPKEDEKVQLLLQNREDIFNDYSLEKFKDSFGRHYDIVNSAIIGNTQRTLFLMKHK